MIIGIVSFLIVLIVLGILWIVGWIYSTRLNLQDTVTCFDKYVEDTNSKIYELELQIKNLKYRQGYLSEEESLNYILDMTILKGDLSVDDFYKEYGFNPLNSIVEGKSA